MADIRIKCTNCSAEYPVSEHAEGEKFPCPSCGTENIKQVTEPSSNDKDALRLRKKETRKQAVTPENYERDRAETIWNFRRQMTQGAPSSKEKGWSARYAGSWILFIVLAGVAVYLRYGGILPEQYLSMLRSYSPYMMIAFHVVIVLKAFKDSVYQGILCLLVPFYSVYYLLVISDDFYMRAVFAGLAAGTGEDTAVFLQERLNAGINAVNHFIETGAGSVR
jgi:hypothetical protein